MNISAAKVFTVIAIGIATLNCVLATAQIYSTSGTYTNVPGRSDYGYGYAGVDSHGRLYGNAVGNGAYGVGTYDANGVRRQLYGDGYNRDSAFSYGRPDTYNYGRDGRDYSGRDNYGRDGYNRGYYGGYWNSAMSSQKVGFIYWLTLGLTTILALKVFA